MKALAFGTYDVAAHPRVRVLINGLRAHGVDVLEVNEPLGLSTEQRVKMLSQPWRLPALAIRLAQRWSRLVGRVRSAKGPGARDFVLVGYLGHFDVLLARLLFPRTCVALDHLIFAGDTAVDRGRGSLGRARLLRLLDLVALSAASVIVVDTDEHRAMVPSRLRPRTVVVPVGASEDWFIPERRPTPTRASSVEEPLRIIFFGLFTPLQGAPVLAAAIRLLHERGVPTHVTIIGSGQDSARVREQLVSVPNLHWHEWVEPEALPRLVADHDVCLGIFGTSAKARRVVPNKIYQGAAAGTTLVTSDTPPQRRAFAGSALFVPAGDAHALADALQRLAGDRQLLATLKAEARATADRHYCPAAVVTPLIEVLKAEAACGGGHT